MTYETPLHPSGWFLLGVVATLVTLVVSLAAYYTWKSRCPRCPRCRSPWTDYEFLNAGSRLWHVCRSCGWTQMDQESQDRAEAWRKGRERA